VSDQLLQMSISDSASLDRFLSQAPGVTREELIRFMTGATQYLEGETQERTPRGAHGALAKSIFSRVQATEMTVLGTVGSPLDYAEAVELGSRPHWAPIQPLQEWARLKLGLPASEADDAARRIQLAIAHRGTLGVGMFHQAAAAGRSTLEHQLGATVRRIGDRLRG